MTIRSLTFLAVCTFGIACLSTPAVADDATHAASSAIDDQSLSSFSLRGVYPQLDVRTDAAAMQDAGVGTVHSGVDEGVLSGPYFLRSADPEPLGELELKFIYGYATGGGEDGEHELEFVLEWGILQNIEFILEVAGIVGDGGIEGNGDIEAIGFHVKFWDEDGWIPAFATRSLMRLPTGYHSSGVDSMFRGLFTKTLIDGSMRLHVNPFLTLLEGSINDNAGDYEWGIAVGIEHRCSDNLIAIIDYQYRDQDEGDESHFLELGADWSFADHEKLAFGTVFDLGSDDNGPDWEFKISYIYSFDVGGLPLR